MYLDGKNITGGYGGPDIIEDMCLSVDRGETVVIVGPNGCGKSTSMKSLFGMLNIREGHVYLAAEDITHLSPQDRVKKGCLLYTSPSPRDGLLSRMPSSA